MNSHESSLVEELSAKYGSAVKRIKILKGFLLNSTFSKNDLRIMGRDLFSDNIIETFSINEIPWEGFDYILTIGYKPGVTDNVGHSASLAVRDLKLSGEIPEEDFVHSFKCYGFWGGNSSEIENLSRELHNPLIQFANLSENKVALPDYDISKVIRKDDLVKNIKLIHADDEELLDISKKGLLALNLDEMKKIQEYYLNLGREPTDIELETFAQTWSEHCVHKTLKGNVNFTIHRANGTIDKEKIDNLIKSTIFSATKQIQKNRGKEDICVSVFKDNAGIIKFNEKYNICFKVETHNHPSAKEPYGGAATGIGGVIRDILAAGLGAKPIANSDIFCFAEPNYPQNRVPEGVIHPRRIMEGVVAGVRDYGNPMGIPTVNGSIYFDERYVGNPLVFCGTAGIIPRFINGKPTEEKKPKINDYLVFVGGKTGRDGIHGVTFASLEMDKNTSSNPVQIGDPITEQMFMEAMFKARNEGLYTFVQDCGGGGLSSAFGEMAEELGAIIQLDKVPLKYKGLLPWEIWISESQERQAFSVPPENYKRFKEIFESENVGVYKIGQITGDKNLVLKYGDVIVGELDVGFLHKGVPTIINKATWKENKLTINEFLQPENLVNVLKKILGSWNVCSKEWVIRQYDSEVQGKTVIKPLQGLINDGPGDGAVIKADPGSNEGIAIANGMNPYYGDLDPYWMTASGIDEAIRNIVCCGADPNHIAILDNFCWGNPKDERQMGNLVLACKACKDISIPFGTPFISGKDSLNNEYITDNGLISIPSTLLISSIGKIPDISKSMTMYFKQTGNKVYIIGETGNELGGSHYLKVIEKQDENNQVPRVFPEKFKLQYECIHKAINKGIIKAAHDCSEGGLAVCLAEMCFSGKKGAEIVLSRVPVRDEVKRDDLTLFSESNGRIIVEVDINRENEFTKLMNNVACECIGEVIDGDELKIIGYKSETVISANIIELKRAWKKPLDFENNLVN